jgi:DNA-directed RNA polymerase subunit RPC12/RpoP
MANYYCEHCGTKSSSVSSLTSNSCMRHPNGAHKGKHVLYQGNEKSQYVCKYCGTKSSSISSLTSNSCMRHPNGSHKGKHSPAL